MKTLFVVLAAVAGLGLAEAPMAASDPGPDGYENVYGLYTPDEKQEVWANGQRNCVTIDQAVDSGRVATDAVRSVIDQYLTAGWDLESSTDIAWESAEGQCPEYMDAVKRAVRSYGDQS
ncbi:hypothetical protein [Mycobacterium sp. C31M]